MHKHHIRTGTQFQGQGQLAPTPYELLTAATVALDRRQPSRAADLIRELRHRGYAVESVTGTGCGLRLRSVHASGGAR